jgi:hypothetical protein
MVEGDFRTQARLSQHLKDIRLILDAAAVAGQDLPLTETHRRLLEAAEAAGFGDADNSAIIPRAFDRNSQGCSAECSGGWGPRRYRLGPGRRAAGCR